MFQRRRGASLRLRNQTDFAIENQPKKFTLVHTMHQLVKARVEREGQWQFSCVGITLLHNMSPLGSFKRKRFLMYFMHNGVKKILQMQPYFHEIILSFTFHAIFQDKSQNRTNRGILNSLFLYPQKWIKMDQSQSQTSGLELFIKDIGN